MAIVGRDINSLYGDWKTPEGEGNSIIGGSTNGLGTQTPQGQDNSTAQTGVVQNADADVGPKETAGTLPVAVPQIKETQGSNDLLGNANVNLMNQFATKDFLQPTGYDEQGQLMLNKTVVGYPNLNDSALKTIQAGIPVGKAASSGIGLPTDLSMSSQEANSYIDLINRYAPKYSAENPQMGASLKAQVDGMINAYNAAKNSGNGTAAAEALAQLKLTLGGAANTLAGWLNGKQKAGLSSVMEEEDQQILWNAKTQAQDFATYYHTSGKDLNTYLQSALTPDSTTYQIRAVDEGSRIAKQEMLTNPFYVQFLNQTKYTNKLAYDKLISDATADTVTYYEKQFIKQFQPMIDKIYTMRRQYADKYGRAQANNLFAGYDQLLELSKLDNKTYMDDIMDSMYTGIQSSAQTLLLDFSSPLFR